MKITRLETFSTRYLGFVRLTAEDGSQGWGQVSPYHADITALVFHRQVAPWALGADVFDIDGIADHIRDVGQPAATIGERIPLGADGGVGPGEGPVPPDVVERPRVGLVPIRGVAAEAPVVGRDQPAEHRLRDAHPQPSRSKP